MLRIFLLISIFSIPILAKAQYYNLFSDFGKSAFVDVKTHAGRPIVYSDSLDQSLRNTFVAIDYRFGINSFNRTPQDELLNYPNYGIGFTHYNMHSDTLGNVQGIYGFFASPLFTIYNRLKIGFEIAAGVSYNFNEFNLITNPKNDLIGSEFNVYFNLGAWYALQVHERLDILASLDFTHFSNGNLNTPNVGINLIGGNLGLRYHFQFLEKRRDDFARIKKSDKRFTKLNPYYEWATYFGLSPKAPTNPPFYDGAMYFCGSISTDVNRRYSWIGKYGVGLDLFYDHSMIRRHRGAGEIDYTKNVFVGIHGNHEFIVGDISLVIQIGTYLYRGTDAKGDFFLRTGLKYDLGERWFANLSLKSQNGMKADYIEAGMGFRVGKKEPN
jgi:hypothetical protein